MSSAWRATSLTARLQPALDRAEARSRESGEPARLFTEFRYSTLKTWSRPRRVVGKAEWLPRGANPRFIVTSLSPAVIDRRVLYEQLYCARGEMENRIKEVNSTSSPTGMRANQLRLWLASMAYVLLSALRRIALPGTRLAKATCGSIRLKLLKIGAQVRLKTQSPWPPPVPKPISSPRLTDDYATDLSPRPRNRPPVNNKETRPGRAPGATISLCPLCRINETATPKAPANGKPSQSLAAVRNPG